MINYVYDGSFDGLLTAIYEAYYRKERPNRIIREEDYKETLLNKKVDIETNHGKAQKVYNSIKNKISNRALQNVFYVFLSELEEAGTLIYEYLKYGWKIGGNIDNNIVDNRVLKVHKIRQRVKGERHRMLGLLRFRCLEGDIYYGPFEPQYNIVGIVAPHFTKRLSNQNWLIHDIKRGIGAVYNKREWFITDIDSNQSFSLDKEELYYQNLWKEYFKSIAIKNRINKKLQKRNMPMRYWHYLIEKDI